MKRILKWELFLEELVGDKASLETVKKKIPSSYSIIYEKDFILNFIQEQVKKDFDVEITHSTHTKLILKNNNFR